MISSITGVDYPCCFDILLEMLNLNVNHVHSAEMGSLFITLFLAQTRNIHKYLWWQRVIILRPMVVMVTVYMSAVQIEQDEWDRLLSRESVVM